jgi:hypothetical protein
MQKQVKGEAYAHCVRVVCVSCVCVCGVSCVCVYIVLCCVLSSCAVMLSWCVL